MKTQAKNAHVCHLPSCKAECPPAHLMCAKHWRMVSKPTQAKVYSTVRRRGTTGVDSTWAPWWRAQARAIDEVLKIVHPNAVEQRAKVLARDLEFANRLDSR